MGWNDWISPAECRVVCRKCGKTYLQAVTEQEPGFRWSEEDKCPYCGHVAKESMSYEFHNRRSED